VVVNGQKDMDWGSLVGDGPQEMAVKCAGSDQTRKGNTSYPQLSGEFLINDAGIGPGVDEGDQGMGAL